MSLGAGEHIHAIALLNVSLLIPNYLLHEMREGGSAKGDFQERLWRNTAHISSEIKGLDPIHTPVKMKFQPLLFVWHAVGQSCDSGYTAWSPQQCREGGRPVLFLISVHFLLQYKGLLALKHIPLISSISLDECRTQPMVSPFPFSHSLCWIFPQIIYPSNPFSEALQTDIGVLFLDFKKTTK